MMKTRGKYINFTGSLDSWSLRLGIGGNSNPFQRTLRTLCFCFLRTWTGLVALSSMGEAV